MNKKTISNIFVAVAICLAFMQQTLWVSIGLMIAAIVICGDEKNNEAYCTVSCACFGC